MASLYYVSRPALPNADSVASYDSGSCDKTNLICRFRLEGVCWRIPGSPCSLRLGFVHSMRKGPPKAIRYGLT